MMNSLPKLREMTLLHLVRRGRDGYPDALAVRDASTSLTYGALWDRASRAAGGLRRAGINHGDAVMMMLDNSAEAFVAFVALSFLGAIPVPTNPTFRGALLEHLVTETGCVAAIVSSERAADLRAAGAGQIATIISRESDPADQALAASGEDLISWSSVLDAEPIEPIEVGPWDVLAIICTSGTTGLSKGVLTTHAQAISMCRHLSFFQDTTSLSQEDVHLVVAPLFHAFGIFAGLVAPLLTGASAYVVAAFRPSMFWEEVRKSGATMACLVGPMTDFILAQPASDADADNSLASVYILPRTPSAADFEKRFNVQSASGFGSSEAGTTMLNVESADVDRGIVGRPRMGLQARLVDEHDFDVEQGEVGELIVRDDDPWVMTPGYVGRPEATVELYRNGWMHTGDLMRVDDAGLFHFVDRAKDSIRRRGENISSFELELQASDHPGIAECAAVGVGHPADQEVLLVVRRTQGVGVSETEIVEFLIGRVPHFCVPRYVHFVEDFPRTPTGKIRKRDLRELGDVAWDREVAGIVVRRPPLTGSVTLPAVLDASTRGVPQP